MEKKSSLRPSGLGRVMMILAGGLLIADTLFVLTRSNPNLGVILPALIGAPLLLIGAFLPYSGGFAKGAGHSASSRSRYRSHTPVLRCSWR